MEKRKLWLFTRSHFSVKLKPFFHLENSDLASPTFLVENNLSQTSFLLDLKRKLKILQLVREKINNLTFLIKTMRRLKI